jgi:hypothetical protein
MFGGHCSGSLLFGNSHTATLRAHWRVVNMSRKLPAVVRSIFIAVLVNCSQRYATRTFCISQRFGTFSTVVIAIKKNFGGACFMPAPPRLD